jgi:hypothetical protein
MARADMLRRIERYNRGRHPERRAIKYAPANAKAL